MSIQESTNLLEISTYAWIVWYFVKLKVLVYSSSFISSLPILTISIQYADVGGTRAKMEQTKSESVYLISDISLSTSKPGLKGCVTIPLSK